VKSSISQSQIRSTRQPVNLAGQTLTGFTAGQTVKLSVRAGNTAGPEVTVTTTA
jgi:hypothetical protein